MNKNYEIIEQRRIEDLNSEGIILKHKKTGAMVTLLLNDDENKVFYIGFRTPPEDSTGVAHILEHSVLCGSKEFPVKDPFIELAKGSLNTFLNAMTYPDKTVYPVASCNDKDFHNLVHVYLDAVFHPNIYREEKIFRQEGWHYELSDKDDDLTVNGVVYNEMKGAYSSPDDVVERKIMNSLYPDTTYGLDSGGDPEVIPTLTYEEFLDFHGKFYHPSNSYIYLYGNMDADEYLTFIDEHYLSNYDYLEVDSEVKMQTPFEAPKYLKEEYSVLEDSEEDGTYLTYNVAMGTSLDRELYVAIDVLDYVLCSAPGAILRQALIDAGIGEDVYSSIEGGILQPYFSITAKNAPSEKLSEFVNIIENELRKTVENGLPKRSMKAALNHFEFKYREADFGSYPRGLMLGLQAFDSWLYDKKAPFMHIEANGTYKKLKDAIDTDYFEKLIEKYILNNNHKTILSIEPKAGLTAIKEEELKRKLQTVKNMLSDAEIEKIVSNTKALKDYQTEPSPEEDLAKIPMLGRDDLKKEAFKEINEVILEEDTKIVFHDVFTNGIGYLSVMFDLKDVPAELFKYIGILGALFGLLDTENYSYRDLFDEINISTGGISAQVSCAPSLNTEDKYRTFFSVKARMLYGEERKTFELIKEMLTKVSYADEKRINDVVTETKVKTQSSMTYGGHAVAVMRAMSYFSYESAINEIVGGVDFLRTITEYADAFNEKKDELIDGLKKLTVCIFRPENLLVGYTSDKEGFKEIPSLVTEFKKALFSDECIKGKFEPSLSKKNEAFMTAGQVQYVCRAGNFAKKGLPYTGALRVLKVMMGYDYLWNNIRVLGGAYGCMSGFQRTGNCYFVSYRDPNLTKTIEVFENASEYIKNVELNERTMTQYVIGTMSEIDTPMTPKTKGEASMSYYLMGLTDEDRQKERDEILNVTEKDIIALWEYIDAFIKDENLCVVGNAEAIKENAGIFKSVEQLF